MQKVFFKEVKDGEVFMLHNDFFVKIQEYEVCDSDQNSRWWNTVNCMSDCELFWCNENEIVTVPDSSQDLTLDDILKKVFSHNRK